jgi:hypothetical protein
MVKAAIEGSANADIHDLDGEQITSTRAGATGVTDFTADATGSGDASGFLGPRIQFMNLSILEGGDAGALEAAAAGSAGSARRGSTTTAAAAV